MVVRPSSTPTRSIVQCPIRVRFFLKSRPRLRTQWIRAFEWEPNGLVPFPGIPGGDAAGVVAEVGEKVYPFNVGNQVFTKGMGDDDVSCSQLVYLSIG
ncbi:alcohol dehydrogenase catalytic domain-containing protein [Halococcus hamelinensis]|uniref:alcohol dehydrogenase catalytic domain-containing protein n=1 Tax=Halococcus hamelinensis TaxID=332168 RepID=UPI00126769D7|nr:alcohol dehydrogenase catalytic domain-containing protein [Halococcus hamelinensis]